MTATVTPENIRRELGGDSYLMRVQEDNGYYDLTNSEPEAWDSVSEYVEIVAVLDSPLQGWATGEIVWQYAVMVEHQISGEQFAAFVGQEQRDA